MNYPLSRTFYLGLLWHWYQKFILKFKGYKNIEKHWNYDVNFLYFTVSLFATCDGVWVHWKDRWLKYHHFFAKLKCINGTFRPVSNGFTFTSPSIRGCNSIIAEHFYIACAFWFCNLIRGFVSGKYCHQTSAPSHSFIASKGIVLCTDSNVGHLSDETYLNYRNSLVQILPIKYMFHNT